MLCNGWPWIADGGAVLETVVPAVLSTSPCITGRSLSKIQSFKLVFFARKGEVNHGRAEVWCFTADQHC